MNIQPIGPRSGEIQPIKDTQSAAGEFEALLIGQMLESAFSENGMGLGDSDSGAKAMMDFGREHLARVMAKGGGLGLASVVEAGLKR
jgi:Rod binding domain-containing protein